MDWGALADAGKLAAGGLRDFASNLTAPTIRIGVTGLSRSGKTVFITSMIHALLNQARLPVFEAQSGGRILRAYLEPQPDDDLPRFAYENHVAALTHNDRHWPESTRQISQLRLTLEYAPIGFWARNFSAAKLHIDIVDYPGEWLLDLPLMNLTYQQWSHTAMQQSRTMPRLELARDWLQHASTINHHSRADETAAIAATRIFTDYLRACRQHEVSLSSLPPGRFLMPGDLEGSPLLSFAPLDVDIDQSFRPGTMGAMMEKRYNSYVSRVVKPFYFGHFARLDRQIVLVDALTALNAGQTAVADLRNALTEVLGSFRLGTNSIVSQLFGKRIDKVLFAATKADLLHHQSHDRLEAILRLLVEEAAQRAEIQGVAIDVAAIAAVRATREASVHQKSGDLPCIAGFPEKGERVGKESFDGATEAAIFTGDLPSDPLAALQGLAQNSLRFARFRPPMMSNKNFPHIRLDRALQFLLGDRFA